MIRSHIIILLAGFITMTASVKVHSQEKINWISFNQLNDSLQVKPKKVFVNFYADWCVYCKEMDRTSFQNKNVIKQLNENFYAVKMNIENGDVIKFGGQTYINKRIKKPNPVHEIALLLASRKNKPFSLPVYLIFNEGFTPKARFFQYLDVPALLKVLE